MPTEPCSTPRWGPLQAPAALFDNPHPNEIGFFQTLNTPHGLGADAAQGSA
jgi:hypothetical protein